MALNLDHLSDDIIQWRRELHQIPEIGLHLPDTQNYVCQQLDKLGIEHAKQKNTSGIVAIIRGMKPGKTFALRADMDALPIMEHTDLPFQSKKAGLMHACGHDVHTAIMLGVAQLLIQDKDSISGNVKIIFQAGEEGFEGASYMVEEGALENPLVDAIMALHVVAKLDGLRPGIIGLKKGELMASNDVFCITVSGQGGHISDIGSIINPVTIASRIAIEIDELEELSKIKGLVAVGVACLNAGGKENIIPATAVLKGSIRSHCAKERAITKESLENICKNHSTNDDATCNLQWISRSEAIVNDPTFTQEIIDIAKETISQEFVELQNQLMASEDIFYFFQKVKGTYIHLHCGFEDESLNYSLHNPNVIFDEAHFVKGAVFMKHCALEWLSKNA